MKYKIIGGIGLVLVLGIIYILFSGVEPEATPPAASTEESGGYSGLGK